MYCNTGNFSWFLWSELDHGNTCILNEIHMYSVLYWSSFSMYARCPACVACVHMGTVCLMRQSKFYCRCGASGYTYTAYLFTCLHFVDFHEFYLMHNLGIGRSVKMKFKKYSRTCSTLKHESAKFFNHENFRSYGTVCAILCYRSEHFGLP